MLDPSSKKLEVPPSCIDFQTKTKHIKNYSFQRHYLEALCLKVHIQIMSCTKCCIILNKYKSHVLKNRFQYKWLLITKPQQIQTYFSSKFHTFYFFLSIHILHTWGLTVTTDDKYILCLTSTRCCTQYVLLGVNRVQHIHNNHTLATPSSLLQLLGRTYNAIQL